jgi:molybdate transport system regulatory protein
MELSARNKLIGTVTKVTVGEVMGEVDIAIAGGNTVVAAITKTSVETMGIKVGDTVTAIIKSTEVIVAK